MAKECRSAFWTEFHALREFIYGVGCPEGNEQIYMERYETHNRRVLEYFQGRRGDLLVMNIQRRWLGTNLFFSRNGPPANEISSSQ